MFRFVPNPTFTVPVPLSVPGMPEQLEHVHVTFRHQDKTPLDRWLAGWDARPDAAVLGEVIVDWKGVTDEQGDEVPYKLTNLAALCERYPIASKELLDAYLGELTASKKKTSRK